jgi:D-cysteine desulfhydrase family pyridoxal phosphate-dependent enzyme
MDFESLPRVPLACLPTPVQELPRLSRLLGCRLLVKRDDLTGLAFGGNKIRKLELLVGDALGQKADLLITTGAPQSNHCRQTAAAAAKLGFGCMLVLSGNPQTADSGNLLLDSLVGAELVWSGEKPRDLALKETFDRAKAAGSKPYVIPYGGSNPLGAVAYALAARELKEQGIRPDWIVFASSSGGTQAGIVLGARLFDLPGRIHGISVDLDSASLREKIRGLIFDTVRRFEIAPSLAQEPVSVDDRFLGAGYGKMGALEREAIRLFARQEGMLLDPVYTGRAAGGMLEMIRNKEIAPSETVLFWHTGGTPALWAYGKQLMEES